MKKNWEKLLQIALLFVGTYGERFFIFVHTFLSSMSPELFSFICITIIFVTLTGIINKH